MRKVDEHTPHAYMLKGQGSRYRTSYNLSGNAFLNHYGIEPTESIRREAYLEDGILCVALKDPGVIVTARRKDASGEDASGDDN